MRKGVEVKVGFPELDNLKRAFDNLRPSLAKKHMGAAIRRSLKPGVDALRSTTPKGPTGNLRRAIASKVKTYANGGAVGLVGYTAAGSGKTKPAASGTVKKGKNLGYHMGFLEFGTKERHTKGPIASSFKRLGPFKLKSNTRLNRQGRRLVAQAQRLNLRAYRQTFQDQASAAALMRQASFNKLSQAQAKFRQAAQVRTSPAYPLAFFKRAARGQRVYLSSMPIGGSSGQPPVRTAYERALPEMRAVLPVEMAKSVRAALRDMADKFPPKPGTRRPPATPF